MRDEVRGNREAWDAMSERYQRRHGPQLGERPMVWGQWSAPESEVGALGNVSGQRLLELGCGGGQWSAFLSEEGAEAVGIDLSASQLEFARRFTEGRVPLVLGDAEDLPFADGSFEIVFCDHGATSWADPYRTVPEAARVLVPGGRLAFNMTSPIATLCVDDDADRLGPALVHDYFGLHAVGESGTATTYNLPYGEWIRVLTGAGLAVVDLIEIRPPEDAESTYCDDLDWARRWPNEALWVARKP